MIQIFYSVILPSLVLPPAVRTSISFPSLAEVCRDNDKAVPGTKLVSPPFEVGGSSWQVALYPYGVGDSYANRVGVYLKLAGKSEEVDATFALQLQMKPSHAAPDDPSTARGLRFQCGMTFCDAREAGESVGRCEDWGAHTIDSASFIEELLDNRACVAAVDVELRVWAERPCRAGSGFAALREQTERLSRGCVRVGEVTVALSGGATANTAGVGTPSYTCVPGIEYRLLRITSADGSPMFSGESLLSTVSPPSPLPLPLLMRSHLPCGSPLPLISADASSEPGSTVYLLPTSKAARGDDETAGELAGARRTVSTHGLES